MFKQFLTNLKTQRNGPRIIVAGNSSCDLDSVVSSICYSYFHNSYYHETVCQPYLDIEQKDLKLRKDIEFVLNKFEVNHSHLLFQNNLDQFFAAAGEEENEGEAAEAEAAAGPSGAAPHKTDLVLVDHNNIQNKNLLHANGNTKTKIAAIIDHHTDEKQFQDADPRIIETCGSCSSLVLNHWYDLFENSPKVSGDWKANVFSPVAEMIIAPILADTSNFQYKITPHDLKAIETLKQLLKPSFSTNNFFQELHAQKLKIEGLTVTDVLRKDYKLLTLQSGTNIGFSSLPQPLQSVLSQCGNNDESEYIDQITQYCNTNNLDALVIMCAFNDSNDKFQRQIALFHMKDDIWTDDVVSQLKSKLSLEPDFEIKSEQVYKQQDISSSRKQVLPLIKSLLSV